jgi:hypothetical protein
MDQRINMNLFEDTVYIVYTYCVLPLHLFILPLHLFILPLHLFILPGRYIYYTLSRNKSFLYSQFLAGYLNYMTCSKILELKEILDRNTPFDDFDNLKAGMLEGYMPNRIGFFRGRTHILSVWSTQSWAYLQFDNNEFHLKPRNVISPRSLSEEQLWSNL